MDGCYSLCCPFTNDVGVSDPEVDGWDANVNLRVLLWRPRVRNPSLDSVAESCLLHPAAMSGGGLCLLVVGIAQVE